MANKSIKLKDNHYIDSTGVVHNRGLLSTLLGNILDDITYLKNRCIYSTNEVPIGKWIDGKTVYRRVYTGNSNEFEINIPNLDKVVKLYGRIYATYRQYWGIPNYHTEAGYCNGYYVEKNSTKIHIWTGGFYSSNAEYFIVVEYTKN